jgi:hypothetical protein
MQNAGHASTYFKVASLENIIQSNKSTSELDDDKAGADSFLNKIVEINHFEE